MVLGTNVVCQGAGCHGGRRIFRFANKIFKRIQSDFKNLFILGQDQHQEYKQVMSKVMTMIGVSVG